MSVGLDIRDEVLFLDDGVEPVQWASALQSHWRLPEQKLLFALLLDTYRLLFVRSGRADRRDHPAEIAARNDAIAWVRDRRGVNDSPYGFPFLQMCEELQINGKYVRAKFLWWIKRGQVGRDIRRNKIAYKEHITIRRVHRRSAA